MVLRKRLDILYNLWDLKKKRIVFLSSIALYRSVLQIEGRYRSNVIRPGVSHTIPSASRQPSTNTARSAVASTASASTSADNDEHESASSSESVDRSRHGRSGRQSRERMRPEWTQQRGWSDHELCRGSTQNAGHILHQDRRGCDRRDQGERMETCFVRVRFEI